MYSGTKCRGVYGVVEVGCWVGNGWFRDHIKVVAAEPWQLKSAPPRKIMVLRAAIMLAVALWLYWDQQPGLS